MLKLIRLRADYRAQKMRKTFFILSREKRPGMEEYTLTCSSASCPTMPILLFSAAPDRQMLCLDLPCKAVVWMKWKRSDVGHFVGPWREGQGMTASLILFD
ncbi:uncharacterized protein LOC143844588 [Paroedura picta]|uniref:uncharacterized protein LOC143844588 n=1 Tax=Paroedura picta TaxID=143630 RepID=UPI0040562094